MNLLAFPRPARRIAAAALATCLSATMATAQTPTLSASTDNVVPGTSIALTVTGTPGEYYAIVGSIVGNGGSYAGLALAVGADYAIVAEGMLDGTGRAIVAFAPPFLGSVIDRVYLQAATSSSPTFMPAALSAGRVLRNNDLVSGLTGLAGPAGPVGPTGVAGPAGVAGMDGATGPAGPAGAAGAAGLDGALGAAGPIGMPGPMGMMGSPGMPGMMGLMGMPGSQGPAGVGYRTDCGNGNVSVWNVGLSAWTCSAAVADLQTVVQALTARLVTLEGAAAPLLVDAYLNSLPLSMAFPIGTSLAITGNNNGTACMFRTGDYYLMLYGSDHSGYLGGRVLAYDDMGGGYYDNWGAYTVRVTTAQVLARCATGLPYRVVQ